MDSLSVASVMVGQQMALAQTEFSTVALKNAHEQRSQVVDLLAEASSGVLYSGKGGAYSPNSPGQVLNAMA